MCVFNFNNSYVMIQGGDKKQSALLMLAVQAPTTTTFQRIFVVMELQEEKRSQNSDFIIRPIIIISFLHMLKLLPVPPSIMHIPANYHEPQ